MKHIELNLTNEDVLAMYKTMLLARRLDERMWLLNRSGKVPFVISGQGQEAAQVGAAFALNPKEDYIAPYYRDMGVVLHFGMTAEDLMMSAFAKAADPNSGGRQMPGHFGGKKYRILTGSSPVATQIPHAVGMALAGKMDGKNFVTFVSLGEGSTNQGDFHEALNFAGVHKLPVITFVENNNYAISVPFERQVASKTVAERATSYGMVGVRVDGTDPLAVYEVMQQAVTRAKNGEGGTIVEAMTYRLTAHSSDDDHRQYRDREELASEKEHDPLPRFEAYLREHDVLTDELAAQLEVDIKRTVNEATDKAEAAPYAEPESALQYVYKEE
ncbi:thiamine pyrophosphate-dependent dehydrogenase E1 component subunit alpha [Caryophanon latum]|uniref:2-oxoisovalerate dehydrogenase subunit alpha n=1 Tax=Caryophanon latum TaxID=33977 RepID=A0A1C0YUS1_9BACL|nr:thiamine pyrophosphate-dependent dehydrogenase E1 component subunit alpha [Caryophanon latum]OCS90891.1 2-oxoisovalerate dehydrogenase [Caryophanon latum]